MKGTIGNAKLFIGFLLVGLAAGQVNAQIFPNRAMTNGFISRLQSLAKSHTKVFVTDCNLSRVGREKAILLMPVGRSEGTLVLLSKGEAYNGSGIAYDASGVALIDPGGGESSQRQLQEIANQLSRLKFSLREPQDVISLMTTPSSNDCPEPPQ